jgi:hypothetical protein
MHAHRESLKNRLVKSEFGVSATDDETAARGITHPHSASASSLSTYSIAIETYCVHQVEVPMRAPASLLRMLPLVAALIFIASHCSVTALPSSALELASSSDGSFNDTPVVGEGITAPNSSSSSSSAGVGSDNEIPLGVLFGAARTSGDSSFSDDAMAGAASASSESGLTSGAVTIVPAVETSRTSNSSSSFRADTTSSETGVNAATVITADSVDSSS